MRTAWATASAILARCGVAAGTLVVQTLAVGAQEPQEVVTATLVGPSETAQLHFSHGAVARPDVPIRMMTTLPVVVGTDTIPAGTSWFWIRLGKAPGILITRDSAAAADGTNGRLVQQHLKVETVNPPATGVRVAVRTVRHGIDTLGVTDRSSKTVNRISIDYKPATSSVLVIWWESTKLTIPIAAR